MFRKIVSFNATIDTKIEDVNKVYEKLSQLALDTAHLTEHVMVSTYDYVDKPDEGFPGDFHDDMTMFRVMAALSKSGLNQAQCASAINEMHNAGILFRERHPEKNVTLMDAVSAYPQDMRPHSRACGIVDHSHGKACSENCPSCGGKDEPLYKLPEELNPKINIPPMYNA
jgi:hypothetical protein